MHSGIKYANKMFSVYKTGISIDEALRSTPELLIKLNGSVPDVGFPKQRCLAPAPHLSRSVQVFHRGRETPREIGFGSVSEAQGQFCPIHKP